MSGRLACVMPRVVAATSGFLLGFQCNTRFETSQPWGVYWCHAPVLRGLALWMPIRLVGRAWTSDDGLQHGSGFDPLRHLHADRYCIVLLAPTVTDRKSTRLNSSHVKT